jgi:hypothetical protein
MHRSLLIIGFLVIVILSSLVTIRPAASEPLDVVAEGRDFATQVLHDPWDMKEYTDVSQYLNASGNYITLDNVSVADGLFTAREFNNPDVGPDAGFHVLFPGYTSALMVGKIGNINQIPSSAFHCLYYAMQVDHLTGNPITSAYWYADDTNTVWGKTAWKTVTTGWKLYKWNLATESENVGTKWADRSNWAGLKIGPIYNSPKTSEPTFTIDWVRLTDCNPVYKSITWPEGGSANIYLKPTGTTREIIVAAAPSSPYDLDIEGVEPGEYTYLVKKSGSTLATGSFTINAAPILTFDKPSMTSGEDFATAAGNRWDMMDSVDAEDTYNCVTESWSDGIMSFDTVDRAYQVSGCYSGTKPLNNNDPIFYLNTPGTIDPSVYRYLSYRIYSDGRPITGSDPTMYYQDIVNGMILRYGVALGPNGNTCKEVSNDIPFDVGWNTYSIDLFKGTDGLFEEWTGSCPSSKYWNQTGPIEIMRLDPNENQLGRTLHQELDWIKLTKMDQAKTNSTFTFLLKANKSAASLSALEFYYTTTLSNPIQHAAVEYIRDVIPTPVFTFLPLAISPEYDDYDQADIRFVWDTSGVSPADYYICVIAGDGYNTASYCSNAPVKVTN